jgi:hypothetical protein
MWSNFSAMPGFLKFLTAYAFGMSVLLFASVIPHGSFVIHGRPVSYAEWWSSGAGPLASFLGIILPISGFLLLRRNPLARVIYLTSIGIAMIAYYLIHPEPASAAFGILLFAFGVWYLYRRPAVVAYFAPDRRMDG